MTKKPDDDLALLKSVFCNKAKLPHREWALKLLVAALLPNIKTVIAAKVTETKIELTLRFDTREASNAAAATLKSMRSRVESLYSVPVVVTVQFRQPILLPN